MMLAYLAGALRFAVVVSLVIELLIYGHRLNTRERWGMGLMGGSAFLTIPVILDINKEGTPFDMFAGMMMSVGLVLYLSGRMGRMAKHEAANQAAIEQARQHFAEKSK